MRLSLEPRERRKLSLALIEGIHLVETFLGRDLVPVSLIVSEAAAGRSEIRRLTESSDTELVVLADGVFNRISTAEAPVGIAAEIPIVDANIDLAASPGCVFLEGIQDAGNIGTILRSAAAFGVPHVILGRGCADPWSPKALRAGMGGHFFLGIVVSADLATDIRMFGSHVICTAANGGQPVDSIDLSGRIGWVFGSEGGGVSEALAALASHKATIAMPGGSDSLNVAASAAICLYERYRQVRVREQIGCRS